MCEWIAFKGENEQSEFWRLANMNPRHFALVAAAAAMHYGVTGRPLVVTSVYRPWDKDSVHSLWRGTDCRVAHPDRVVDPELEGISEDEAQLLCDELNDTFEYLKQDGEPSEVAMIHGEGLNRHLHLQSPWGRQWQA